MKKMFLIATAAVIVAVSVSAQTVQTAQKNLNFEESFEWMRSTFETNDAGFKYIVEQKGRAAYDLHNQIILNKIKTVKNWEECRNVMEEWLRFFRSGHLDIYLLIPDESATQASTPSDEWEQWKGDIAAFEKAMATKQDVDFEGVWEMDEAYKMGIKAEGNGYVGFIIESSEEGWKPGQIRMKITREGEKWKTTYYTRARSAMESGKPELIYKKILRLETGQTLKRISPILSVSPVMENYFKYLTASEPYLERLNSTTLYLRIQSFMLDYKPAIDKLIADNFNKLTSTENLIIDVRGNGGGSDYSWSASLFPLLYTGPTRTIDVSFLSTPLNILNLEANNSPKEFMDRMKSKPGEFVSWFGKDVAIQTLGTVHKYPCNVGIIIDGRCASATEAFLWRAKQSRKVKLFGVQTRGAIDASNKLNTKSPDGRYILYYASSLTVGIQDIKIDEIGMQPDYYLDKSIPDHQWVEYVNEMLNL